MKRRTLILLALALLGSASAVEITAPARNWVLPVFTKEGHRSMHARGSEARVISQREFRVNELNLTLFTGDAEAKVETILLSPEATFLPDEKVAHGEKSVRLIRDDVEASGTRWRYEHENNRVSLDGDVRVVFQAEMKDLLR